ncbi:MAG TPA: NAD(P)/FAD-dependent oxidoreductase [Candidatus Sulfotelmatobacter sp.]
MGPRNSTDVFVIGGGPAGLAAAIAARQRGFSVTVADGAIPPIDKACGENLMPDAIPPLGKLGIRFSADECHTLHGVRFLAQGLSAEAKYPALGSTGVRRTTLHRLLSARASTLGVELLWGTPVTGISEYGVRLGDGEIAATWIIGADGAHSRVRRWAGLEASRQTGVRYGFRRHYRISPWTDNIEVYWSREAQGYVAHVTHDLVCVGLMSRDPRMRADEVLRCFPDLEARLRGAVAVSKDRGRPSLTRRLKQVFRRNVVLVGDASGTVDAITGEGLGQAFSQARILAECLRSEDLPRYQREHRQLAMRPSLMARLMLTLDGRPWLQRRTLNVFRNRPEVFRTLLAMHVGMVSPRHVALNGLTLGWGLITTA